MTTLAVIDGHGIDYWQSQATPAKNSTSNQVVTKFGDSTDTYASALCHMPAEYGGGDLTVSLRWSSWTVNTNNCFWKFEFEKLADNGNDVRANTWGGTAQTVADTPGTSVGSLAYTTLTFTNAQAASIAAGNTFRIRVTRLGTSGSDTMVGDAYLSQIVITD